VRQSGGLARKREFDCRNERGAQPLAERTSWIIQTARANQSAAAAGAWVWERASEGGVRVHVCARPSTAKQAREAGVGERADVRGGRDDVMANLTCDSARSLRQRSACLLAFEAQARRQAEAGGLARWCRAARARRLVGTLVGHTQTKPRTAAKRDPESSPLHLPKKPHAAGRIRRARDPAPMSFLPPSPITAASTVSLQR
jgi:adenine-specific DNA methylase